MPARMSRLALTPLYLSFPRTRESRFFIAFLKPRSSRRARRKARRKKDPSARRAAEPALSAVEWGRREKVGRMGGWAARADSLPAGRMGSVPRTLPEAAGSLGKDGLGAGVQGTAEGPRQPGQSPLCGSVCSYAPIDAIDDRNMVRVDETLSDHFPVVLCRRVRGAVNVMPARMLLLLR